MKLLRGKFDWKKKGCGTIIGNIIRSLKALLSDHPKLYLERLLRSETKRIVLKMILYAAVSAACVRFHTVLSAYECMLLLCKTLKMHLFDISSIKYLIYQTNISICHNSCFEDNSTVKNITFFMTVLKTLFRCMADFEVALWGVIDP